MHAILIIGLFIVGMLFRLFFPDDGFVKRYMNKYLIYFGLPLLVFVSLSKSRESVTAHQLTTIISFSMIIIVLFFFIIWSFPLAGKQRSAVFLCSVFGNTAYIGIPVLYLVFGAAGSAVAGMYSLILLIFHYTLGLWLANYYVHGKAFITKILQSPLLWVLTIAFFLSRISMNIPRWVLTFSEGGVLLAVFIIGNSLIFKHINIKIFIYGMLKLLVAPLLMMGVAVAFGIIDFWPLVLLAAMPPAFTNTSLALEFGFDEEMTSSLTAVGTVLFMAAFFIFFILRA